MIHGAQRSVTASVPAETLDASRTSSVSVTYPSQEGDTRARASTPSSTSPARTSAAGSVKLGPEEYTELQLPEVFRKMRIALCAATGLTETVTDPPAGTGYCRMKTGARSSSSDPPLTVASDRSSMLSLLSSSRLW